MNIADSTNEKEDPKSQRSQMLNSCQNSGICVALENTLECIEDLLDRLTAN